MTRKVETTIATRMLPADQQALAALLRRTDLTPRVRARAEVVKAAALGQDIEALCRWSGRTAETVRGWLRRYLAAGLAGLVDAPRPGRPARADAAYRQALADALDRPPRQAGLLFDLWTAGRLSAYLAETTGVRLSPSWLRTLIAQQRFRCGRPKHTLHHLQDPDAVAACAAELAEAGEKGGTEPRALRIAP
jgi:transposase